MVCFALGFWFDLDLYNDLFACVGIDIDFILRLLLLFLKLGLLAIGCLNFGGLIGYCLLRLCWVD